MKGMILITDSSLNDKRPPLPAPDVHKLIYKDTCIPEISVDYILTIILFFIIILYFM
nr:MAG TPA: hypothetical protein [Caudoviricetes sp.]